MKHIGMKGYLVTEAGGVEISSNRGGEDNKGGVEMNRKARKGKKSI